MHSRLYIFNVAMWPVFLDGLFAGRVEAISKTAEKLIFVGHSALGREQFAPFQSLSSWKCAQNISRTNINIFVPENTLAATKF